MKRALLKIILIAFLVSLVDPVALLARNRNQTSSAPEIRQANKKMYVRAILKATHNNNVNEILNHGHKLPKWISSGNSNYYRFDGLCHILILQNAYALIYKQDYFSSILFPKHFFS